MLIGRPTARLEGRDERLGPGGRGRAVHGGQEAGVSLIAFLRAHTQCKVEVACHTLRVPWVREHRIGELRSGAGKEREDEDAGSLGLLSGHELLGDEIHAVAQRGDQADVGLTVEPSEFAAPVRAIEISDRGPVCFTELAVDAPDC